MTTTSVKEKMAEEERTGYTILWMNLPSRCFGQYLVFRYNLLCQSLLCVAGVISAPIFIAIQLGVSDQPEVRRQLLSIGLFTCGVATILQNLIGCRLPIIQGANTSFIAPMAAIFSLTKWSDESLLKEIPTVNGTVTDEPWKMRMREIQGNLMLASATQFVLGATGLVGFFLRFIGPLTVAPTITVIGLYIGQFALPLCEQHWGIAFLSLALMIIFALFLSTIRVPLATYSRREGCHASRTPIFELIPVILAVGVTWLLSFVLTVTDVLPSNSTQHGHMARTDVRINALYDSPWFYFPLPFQFGMPTVSAAGYVGMLAATIASTIESTGDYFASARVAEVVPPPPHAVNRGVAMEGFSSTIGAMIGGICASTSYSENIGAIAITKIASRKVFVTAGILLVLAGVIGKIGAIFTIIPDPIIGGVNLITLGMVTAVGVSTLQFIDLRSSRNLMIIGTSMMLGLKIPDWMATHSQSIDTGSADFDQVLTVLLSTPMFVAGFTGCFLDNLVPGTEEERGITKWRLSMEGPGDYYITGEDTYEFPYVTQFIRRIKCCGYFPMSPTFDKEFSCGCCCKKRSNSSSYGVDNPVAMENVEKL
ncbi:solute carrier family 23 member 2-like isoform X3 [Haliotis cracherodii]|uniref:solute carrier family 23 member 2-like isoform X3 n=1 Tax=Haliotis cracherodii TaxID=6455 RepID=UPI0039E82FF2